MLSVWLICVCSLMSALGMSIKIMQVSSSVFAANTLPASQSKHHSPHIMPRFGDIIDFDRHSSKQDPCLVINQVSNLLRSARTLNDISFDRKALDKVLEHALSQLKLVKDEVSLDSLTGAYNRASIDRFMKDDMRWAHQTRQPFTVAVMDIDDLKPVNVKHGTLAASLVIRDVVHAAKQQLGNQGKICLYGGDEFVVFLPGLSWAKSKRLLNDIRVGVSNIHSHAAQDPIRAKVYKDRPVHVSLGAASVNFAQPGLDSLKDNHLKIFNLASEALKEAKSQGKNQVRGLELTPPVAQDLDKPHYLKLAG